MDGKGQEPFLKVTYFGAHGPLHKSWALATDAGTLPDGPWKDARAGPISPTLLEIITFFDADGL